MKIYDFDQPVNRKGTNCLKWDFAVERGKPADVLPLWVADMDFPAPDCVREAIAQAAQHGIFGYSDAKAPYYEAVAAWYEREHGWRPEAEWLVKTPGVVYALAMAVQALTSPGEAVMIQPPVYYPFFEVVQSNGRRLVENPLRLIDGRYEMDFDQMEALIEREQVRLFILCSPHNPVGRVWTAAELRRVGDICQRHGVYIVSDEIHCDLTWPEHPHTMFLNAAPELAEQTILCTAPSKTFNMAGLQVSNIWIPSADIRSRFQQQMNICGYSQLNSIGLAAAEAAYRDGAEWLHQLKPYLAENLRFFRATLQERLPALRLIEPEGTYFAWVDFSALGLTDDQLEAWMTQKAKLWLDGGAMFSKDCGQYQRFVLATNRGTIERALGQLERAVKELKE